MCGVFAEWNKDSVFEAGGVPFDLLRHRGPDFAAYISSNSLILFHCRLKIIDLSDTANQPMTTPCGRYSIVFNGEIYNFRELRREIGGNWDWKTNGDTEVILAAWSLWGADSLVRLSGMFAIIVYDQLREVVTLVRDRFGIKPLYYGKASGSWCVASEVKPILAKMDSVEPNLSTIKTYLETGSYDHTDNTFFERVKSVPPGTMINIELGTNSWRYFRWYDLGASLVDLTGMHKAQIEERAESLIADAIGSHLVADVGIGLNVSGGVDSSMLVSHAVESCSDIHLFTQDYQGYSELPWVNGIAKSCSLHIASPTADMIWDRIPETVESQAEPFGGVLVCGYNYLYELAETRGITVLLDGNGVDEIFLGYKRYHQAFVFDGKSDLEVNARAAEYQRFWGESPRQPAPGRAIDGTMGLRSDVLGGGLQSVDGLFGESTMDLGDPVKNMAIEDLLYYKIPRGLRFNDRVSMAHSRELRVPFLDHNLVEFALSIPTEQSFSGNGTKEIFRNILSRREGGRLAYSRKRSVQSPQREWLADEWRPYMKDLLASKSFRNRGWIDPAAASVAYDKYLGGAKENSFFLWQWLNLELWAQTFLD